MKLRMLKWHLIGNWGNRGENDLGFVSAGVKYRSFANAYGHYEKKNATLCVTFKALVSKIPRCSEVAEVYEKANTGSEAAAWCENALSSSEVLQKDRQPHLLPQQKGGKHTGCQSQVEWGSPLAGGLEVGDL